MGNVVVKLAAPLFAVVVCGGCCVGYLCGVASSAFAFISNMRSGFVRFITGGDGATADEIEAVMAASWHIQAQRDVEKEAEDRMKYERSRAKAAASRERARAAVAPAAAPAADPAPAAAPGAVPALAAAPGVVPDPAAVVAPEIVVMQDREPAAAAEAEAEAEAAAPPPRPWFLRLHYWY